MYRVLERFFLGTNIVGSDFDVISIAVTLHNTKEISPCHSFAK